MSTSAPRRKKPVAQPRKKAAARRPARKISAKSAAPRAAPTPTVADAPRAPCIAAIGASAGGFEAIRSFFEAMPADSGIAFVVIQHLPPTQKSLAAELLGRRTKMPVVQAQDGMRIEPDHVYTIPPNTYPSIGRGVLRLAAPPVHGLRLPIDHFFAALGEDQHERAIGMVFSGSGSDGALGVKSIGANGGMVLAQSPQTAPFDGMPQSAISSGMVNHVLPIAKMPEVLVAYARHPYVARAARAETVAESEAAALEAVLDLIRARRGYSFSGYKQSTLMRRILRRMGLRSIENCSDYVAVLKKTPAEVDALFGDLLISVTEFFRDPDAWNILQTEVVGPLVEAKPRGEPIRVWVPGCATGEEAYALAILLLERLERSGKPRQVQVFGTDTNEDVLQIARSGKYPSGIAARISPKRLRRYFVEVSGDHQYQVAPGLREAVVFGVQNLVSDPPFSRLDLISCRNLLIYLEPEVQKKIIALFRFALRPGGYMFLGSAETIGQPNHQFKTISKKWRIYQRSGADRDQPLELPLVAAAPHAPGVAMAIRAAAPRTLQLANRAQQLILDRFAPAAVVINASNEIIYSCGPVESYLRRPRGAPTQDLLAQARDGLRSTLRAALREAAAGKTAQNVHEVRVQRNGGFAPVRVTVMPAGVDADGARMLLAVFQDQADTGQPTGSRTLDADLVRQFEDELRTTRDDLQSSIERSEASNEALKVSNEEVISANEELQSINEELESSKEELQSLNEEMSTVNQQLQVKMVELETANADLRNLLASSEIATICLDRDLRIRWFTPAMKTVFHVIDADVGRPISDFAAVLSGGALLEHAATVLEKKTPIQRELELEGGRWYLRRVVPYRGESERVDGVVVTFTDVTEVRRAAEAEVARTKKAAELLEQTVHQRTVQLRALAVELSLVEERERRSLGQDLHDGLGQLLAIVKHKLTALHGRKGNAGAAGELKGIEELIDQANGSVHTLAYQLSPPVLNTLGLMPALEWLAEEMERVYGLKVRLNDDGAPKPLDEPARTTLFRGVRELLVNVAKHAKVKTAVITSLCSDGRLTLAVGDDGAGFDSARNLAATRGTGGLGLASVRERMEFIGGEMEIDSRPGDGTTVTLTTPLHPAAAETAR